MAVGLALAAALLFSLGTVLQQQVASGMSSKEAGGAGFLLRLARRPRWLAGIAALALGFACQAAALAVGRLVVVQPVLATAVVFSLPLGAKLGGRRVRGRDMVAALAVTGGLAAFLVLADPSGGRDDATNLAWAVSFAVAGVVCGVFVILARGRSPSARAALLGAAAGILFGVAAGLTKATVEQLDDGVLAVIEDWHLYALIVVGYVGMTISQSSFQAGALAPAVSTQMSFDPLASLLLGTLAFEEKIHDSAAGVAGALGGVAVMIAGIAFLAASEQDDDADC